MTRTRALNADGLALVGKRYRGWVGALFITRSPPRAARPDRGVASCVQAHFGPAGLAGEGGATSGRGAPPSPVATGSRALAPPSPGRAPSSSAPAAGVDPALSSAPTTSDSAGAAPSSGPFAHAM